MSPPSWVAARHNMPTAPISAPRPSPPTLEFWSPPSAPVCSLCGSGFVGDVLVDASPPRQPSAGWSAPSLQRASSAVSPYPCRSRPLSSALRFCAHSSSSASSEPGLHQRVRRKARRLWRRPTTRLALRTVQQWRRTKGADCDGPSPWQVFHCVEPASYWLACPPEASGSFPISSLCVQGRRGSSR